MHTPAVVQMDPLPGGNGAGRFADRESILDNAVAFGERTQRYFVACLYRLRSRYFDGFAIAANEDECACLRIAQKGGDIVVGMNPKCFCSRRGHRIP